MNRKSKIKSIKDAIYNFSTLEKMKLPEIKYRLYPAVRERSITQVFGQREAFKTLLTQGMVASMCTGKSCIEGWEAFGKHKALYIDGELPVQDIVERFRDYYKGNLSNLNIYPNDLIRQEDGAIARLLNSQWRNEFSEYLKEEQFGVIVFDNISALASGFDENSKEGWSPLNAFFLELKSSGASIIYNHHAGKGGGKFSRGHSGNEDNLDRSIKVMKTSGTQFSNTPDLIVTLEKFREKGKMERGPRRLQLIDGVWKDVNMQNEDKLKNIITFIDGGMPQVEVGKMFELSQQAISKQLTKARERGLIDDNNRPTTQGMKWLEEDI